MTTRKKAPRKTKKKAIKADWQGFTNVYLSPSAKKEVKELELNDGGLVAWLETVGEQGYKISFGFQPDDLVWTATLIGQYNYAINAGKAMSQRHRDLTTAIKALYYAHTVMSEDGDWDVIGSMAADYDY